MKQSLLAVLYGVLLMAPLPLLLVLSLSQGWTWPHLLPPHWQLRLWQVLWSPGQGIAFAALNSVVIAVVVAVLATGAAFVTSRSLAAHRQRRWLLAAAHLPFAVSPVVLGVSLLYVFIRLHLADHYVGIVLAQFLFAYAYANILMLGFWDARIAASADLAATLGAGRRAIWLRVLLPQAAGILGVCLFQTFLLSWFDYALVLLIGGGRIPTLTLKVFEYFGAGDLRLAAACTLLLMLPPLLALLLNRRLLGARLAGGFGVIE